MSALTGRWLLTDAENLEAMLIAIKSSAEYIAKLRQVAAAIKTNPEAYVKELTVDKAAGTVRRVVYINGEKKNDDTVPIGKDHSGKDSDGRQVTVHVTVESDTKLVTIDKGDGFELKSVVVVTGNEAAVTIVGNGVTATQKYKRA